MPSAAALAKLVEERPFLTIDVGWLMGNVADLIGIASEACVGGVTLCKVS